MGGTAFRLRSLWLGVVAPVALVGLGAPAQAQGIFCPSGRPAQYRRSQHSRVDYVRTVSRGHFPTRHSRAKP